MNAPVQPRTVTLALTGASGMPYGMRLLQVLLEAGTQVYLLYSQAAQIVAHQELGFSFPTRPRDAAAFFSERFGARAGQLQAFGREDWFAPVASGSNPADAMVICPCTVGTLAALACGLADNLIERAADVALKERRPLILVARETPLSAIHLENMLRLTHAGAVILPANPGFYHRPASVEDLVDFVVARVLDQLHIPHNLLQRWGASALAGEPPENGGSS
jgi:4-hydroxy-3-polyprenylbenzoate decarboxylase